MCRLNAACLSSRSNLGGRPYLQISLLLVPNFACFVVCLAFGRSSHRRSYRAERFVMQNGRTLRVEGGPKAEVLAPLVHALAYKTVLVARYLSNSTL